ncbi:hypothetical protein [Bacillus sp. M6-12]|nr:hypothetical protein [Bacillus sp. M6-12]
MKTFMIGGGKMAGNEKPDAAFGQGTFKLGKVFESVKLLKPDLAKEVS